MNALLVCVCVLRCNKTLGEDAACTVEVVVFGVQLNVSSYIDVTMYVSTTNDLCVVRCLAQGVPV